MYLFYVFFNPLLITTSGIANQRNKWKNKSRKRRTVKTCLFFDKRCSKKLKVDKGKNCLKDCFPISNLMNEKNNDWKMQTLSCCPELEKKTHVLGSVRKKEKEHILWLSVGFSMFSYTTNKPDGSPRKKKKLSFVFFNSQVSWKKMPINKVFFLTRWRTEFWFCFEKQVNSRIAKLWKTI